MVSVFLFQYSQGSDLPSLLQSWQHGFSDWFDALNNFGYVVLLCWAIVVLWIVLYPGNTLIDRIRKFLWALFGVFDGIFTLGIESGHIVCDDDNIRLYAVIVLFIKWSALFLLFYSIFRGFGLIGMNRGTFFRVLDFGYQVFVGPNAIRDAFIFVAVYVISFFIFNHHFYTITDFETYLSWNEIAKGFLPLCWR